MITYIAFLRGINVSGQKKVLMADLREMLEKLHFYNVTTYIQSGNVVFNSEEEKIEILSEKIKKGILDTFKFDVSVLVWKSSTIQKILNDNPYKDKDSKKTYFVLLNSIPKEELVVGLNEENYPNEFFKITPNCVYLYCLNGFGRAKCNNNLFERKLKLEATTRNHKTMTKLLEMSMN